MCGVWLWERPHKQSAVNINKGILSRIKVSEQQYLKLRNYWTFLKPTTDTFTDKEKQDPAKKDQKNKKDIKNPTKKLPILYP